MKDYFSVLEDEWEAMNNEEEEEEMTEEYCYEDEEDDYYDGRYDYPNEWNSPRAVFSPNGNYLKG